MNTEVFGLLTLFLVAILVRWNLSIYPVYNPDLFFNSSDAFIISKLGYIPFLLHPFFSFFGMYPASDTAGIIVTEASLYVITPTQNIMYTNTMISLIITFFFIYVTYLIARIFIRNTLCRFIPPLIISTAPYLLRETQVYMAGARGLAFAFFLLFLLVMLKCFDTIEKTRRVRYLILACTFAFGGISSHLMFTYYLPFVVLPILAFIVIKRLSRYLYRFNLISKISPRIKSGYLLVAFVGSLFILPFYGFTIFPYYTKLPQLMVFRFIGIGENVYVAFVWSYVAYFGLLATIGFFGIIALCLGVNNERKQLLILVLIMTSQVYIDLTYFIILFSIFLAILSGIAVEFITKSDNFWFHLVFCTFALIALVVGVVYIYRYQYVELAIFFAVLLFSCIYIGSKIFSQPIKRKMVVVLISIFLVSITPAFNFCMHNYDFSQRIKNDKASLFVATARVDRDTESNSLFLRYFDNRSAVISHSPFYGASMNIASIDSVGTWSSVMRFENVRKNTQISAIEWSISSPKTFFTGTVTIDNKTLQMNVPPAWLIFLYNYFDARRMAHNLDVYYLSEFLPCEGRYFMGVGSIFFESFLLKVKSGYCYCVYQNAEYATYYF
ncbi:MAG: hypothetical protein QXU48_06940 [Thermoplasmata archaeon]